jgi:large subunit ribosomal protein L35
MPKMKTKSGAKKRFRVTSHGRVKAKQSHMRHMQMNKPKSMKRKARGNTTLCDADTKLILDHHMPYNRRSNKKKPKAKQAEGAK